jgi:hypothetical protein
MRRIHLAPLLFLTFLFSCQHNNSRNTATDSLATDTAVAAIDDTTHVEITEAEDESELSGADFDYTYEGLINNKIKVRVNIFQIRGEKMARLVYLNSKKIINMDVAYPAVGTFELTEKIEGKVTGIWKIAVEEEDILSGTWSAADGAKQMPVQLGMTIDDFDNFMAKEEIRTGTYEFKQVNEDTETKDEFPLLSSEDLYVKNMADNSIYFDLYIQGPPPGVHLGMVNGMAYKSSEHYNL